MSTPTTAPAEKKMRAAHRKLLRAEFLLCAAYLAARTAPERNAIVRTLTALAGALEHAESTPE